MNFCALIGPQRLVKNHREWWRNTEHEVRRGKAGGIITTGTEIIA